ncbi:hypothetical protein Y1Q_0014000 [Alligator mississippiensis]|uniref:Uncharacterized protein n=1 Tax=Alligator mississippiensis TaxID=8496 RepID=A0A151PEA6_ALLMI|nr:hypothetical protein Y1Q_0014000 [Alligator mississippiensis]
MVILGAAHPADKVVGEATLVVDNTLQDDGELSLVVHEWLSALRWAEDKDVVTMHSSSIVGEAHAVEPGDHFLWVDKVNEVVCQDILEDQTHLPYGLSSCGLVLTKEVGDSGDF